MAERLNLYLHPSSRTWDPTAETWDLKEMPLGRSSGLL
jgi:hypothetical protein